MHYPGDTYKALNDAKRVTKVAAWLKNAEINLGPVQLPDGSEIERLIEPWVPKKQVKAYNPRQARPMSTAPASRARCLQRTVSMYGLWMQRISGTAGGLRR